MTHKKNLNCPCCGSPQVLRHARSHEVYWFCMNCRQEVFPVVYTPALSKLVLTSS